MAVNFQWKPGSPLPKFEPHSDRKLQVIEKYLDSYFDTVVPNPATEVLRITIVDAFCGGGAYADSAGRRAGSPIVALEAVENAKRRLNAGRKKPLEILPEFYFSDSNPHHVEHLRELLIAEGYGSELGRTIFLSVTLADDAIRDVVPKIEARQRAGRALFILDQCGWKQVSMSSISLIFKRLSKAEVVLTFSIDALLNYLDTGLVVIPHDIEQFGIDTSFLSNWDEWKRDSQRGRSTAQHFVMETIRIRSGARFFTPFMLYSSVDHRWMTVAHLSQSQTARDKMLSVHWDAQNSFRHFGAGSLFELGFDQRVIESSTSMFNFQKLDRDKMAGELLEELPRLVTRSLNRGPLRVAGFIERIANRTAATNVDLKQALQSLSAEREFEVMRRDGGLRRPGSGIKLDDFLVRSAQPRFSIFERG